MAGVGVLPRTVWTYWDDEDGSLGDFNDLCVASWGRNLPGWSIRVVRGWRELLVLVPQAYLPRCLDGLTVHQRADSARLALLRAHGGVWMDVSILLVRGYAWVEAFVGAGHTFVGFSDLGDDRVVRSWWFACTAESPVLVDWNDTWLNWVNEDAGLESLDAFRDEAWPDAEAGERKRYVGVEVALAHAMRVCDGASRALSGGLVKLLDARSGPFWLTGMPGGWNPVHDGRTVVDWVEHEESSGVRVPFVKVTGGQTMLKGAALQPLVRMRVGSALRFLFAVHGHGIYEDGAAFSPGALVVPLTEDGDTGWSRAGVIVVAVVTGLLTLMAIVTDFSNLARWKRSGRAANAESASGSWKFPGLMPVVIVVNAIAICLLVSIDTTGVVAGPSVSGGANRHGLMDADRAELARRLEGGLDRFVAWEDRVVEEAGVEGVRSVVVYGALSGIRVMRRVSAPVRVHVVCGEQGFVETHRGARLGEVVARGPVAGAHVVAVAAGEDPVAAATGGVLVLQVGAGAAEVSGLAHAGFIKDAGVVGVEVWRRTND